MTSTPRRARVAAKGRSRAEAGPPPLVVRGLRQEGPAEEAGRASKTRSPSWRPRRLGARSREGQGPPQNYAGGEAPVRHRRFGGVAPRTHPGVNFPGGAATIREIHDERLVDQGPMRDGSKKGRRASPMRSSTSGGSEKRGVDAQHISKSVDNGGRRSSSPRASEEAPSRPRNGRSAEKLNKEPPKRPPPPTTSGEEETGTPAF